MNLDEIYSDGIDLARKLLDDAGKFLILVAIGLIPVINFTLAGFGARIVRSGRKEIPALNDYIGMFTEGLKIVLVSLIYFIIPVALIVAGIGTALISGTFASILIIAGGALFLFIALIASMGILHMVANNDIGKAFSFREILNIIQNVGWGKYVVWIITIWVTSLIISPISQITGAGWVITALIEPFFIVFAARTGYLIYSEGAAIEMI